MTMKLVQRTLDVLTTLSKESEGLSVTDLAEIINLPNSTTHRILACLKENNFVIQSSDTKKYRLGYKVLTLGSNISKENSFTHSARPFMKELADRIGKTVTLCVMEGDSVVCLNYVESKDTSLFLVRTGFGMPPHATSAGKAMQAYMPLPVVQEIYMNHAQEKVTSNTKTDFELFMRELDDIRKKGYAISDEELQIGVQGVACPIFDYNHKVVASVSFISLKSEQSLTEENIALLKETAQKISVAIGNTQ